MTHFEPPVDPDNATEFLRSSHAHTAYDRVLVVYCYCARVAPNEGIDLPWVCKLIAQAGFSKPNVTSVRKRLLKERGIRKKGTTKHVMDIGKAEAVAKKFELTLEADAETDDAALGNLGSVDVCIVCALVTPEFDAIKSALGLDQTDSLDGDPATYHKGRLDTEAGNIRVVGAAANNMGLSASAVLATKMILAYRPRLVVMPGIIGGTLTEGLGFGDVVVARQTIDYRSGKISQDAEGALHFSGSATPLQTEPQLLGHLAHVKSDLEVELTRAKKKFHGNVPPTEARVHFGDVASGDQVVSSARVVSEQMSLWRKLLGVEMETYGVHRACRDATNPAPSFLSCKAISDSATDKSQKWRKFAAYMSAQFVRRTLEIHFEALVG